MSWKATFRRLTNSALQPLGFTFERYSPEIKVREMASAQVRDRQIEEFKRVLTTSLNSFRDFKYKNIIDAELREFINQLFVCPISQARGGGSYCSAILLWTIARLFHPEIIVESGVFRGFSTWVLRKACPEAKLHAFDISFAELKYKLEGVEYHKMDWMSYDFRESPHQKSLAYFDDHVDQWKRIREAHERGFHYVIFDDSLPSNALHNDGITAVPTVDMLFETHLGHGEEIRWRTECGDFLYRHDSYIQAATRELVINHIRLPDLRFQLGYAPANLILVELVP